MKTCSVPGCETEVRARGLCARHYERERRAGNMTDKKCSVEGCGGGAIGKGLCYMHYARVGRTGSVSGVYCTQDPSKKISEQDKRCSVEGCGRPFHAKGLCSIHHWRLWEHGDPAVLLRVDKYEGKKCRACERRPARCRGLCRACRDWAKRNYAPDPKNSQPKHLPIENIRKVIRAEFPNYVEFAHAHNLDPGPFRDKMTHRHVKFIDWGTADTWCNYLGLHPVLVWPEEWQTFDTKIKKQRYARLVAA